MVGRLLLTFAKGAGVVNNGLQCGATTGRRHKHKKQMIIMQMDTNKKPTLQDLWRLLRPSVTYDTRGRYEKCSKDWNSMDAAQQERVYAIIMAQRENGEVVNPNPCFALNDAMQEDEQRQAKLMKQTRREPVNLNGTARGGTMLEAGKAAIAAYKGQWGIYSVEDVERFELECRV